jgi:hypothetical protein
MYYDAQVWIIFMVSLEQLDAVVETAASCSEVTGLRDLQSYGYV